VAGFRGVVRVVEADADELPRVVDRGVQLPHGGWHSHGLKRASGNACQHLRQHLLGGAAALQKAAGALRKQGRGDGRRAYHSLRGEVGGAAGGQVHDVVLVQVTAKTGALTVPRKAHNFHAGSFRNAGSSAADAIPNASMLRSRSLNFCTLPLEVMGYSFMNKTWRGILKLAICPRQLASNASGST